MSTRLFMAMTSARLCRKNELLKMNGIDIDYVELSISKGWNCQELFKPEAEFEKSQLTILKIIRTRRGDGIE